MAVRLERAVRFATLNVRGLSSRRRQYQLSRLIAEHDLDVIAVQETKVHREDETDRMVAPFSATYNVCVSHADGLSGGCAIFIKRSMGAVETSIRSSESGRFVVCDLSLMNFEWRVICLYAPNRDNERKAFFEEIGGFLDCSKYVILIGDFNCVCAIEDRSKRVNLRDQSALLLTELIAENGLEDVALCMSNGGVEFTHFQGQSHARLDRAYISLDLVMCCDEYVVIPVSFSDHCLVKFTLGTKEKVPKFNWHLWKLNNSIMKDKHFSRKVSEALTVLYEDGKDDWETRWEVFKQDVKLSAIERTTILNFEKKQDEKKLQSQLQALVKEESVKPGSFTEEIKNTKNKLELLDKEKYRGAIIRSRTEKLWMGETPTKRALSDEKQYARRKEVKEIMYNGRLTKEKSQIMNAFVDHYRDLLGKRIPMASGFSEDFLSLVPKLDDETKRSLEAPISIQEIKKAIDDLSTGKTPGPDGIGAEFYKMFKEELASALFEVIEEGYKKKLPRSFTEAHTVLIPKSDDDIKLQSVTSYRPISLLNTDYKIFMKVLAKRMQNVVQNIVGPHQTCGIKGRSITTNIHVVRSVLEICDDFGDRIAMMQIDLQKAFDRVSHEVLFNVLEHVQVGTVFLDGLKMAYSQCVTRLVVNRALSEEIDILSSIRQGCPASALLFAIYLEPFCLSIIQNSNVHGFRLQSTEVKILAYADDVAVLCQDRHSIREVVHTAKQFCSMTGSMINWDKTTAFWYGNWDMKPDVYVNVKWETRPLKYLGVPLEVYRDNNEYWKDEAETIRQKTNAWGGRELSIFARACVCNLFLIAKIWYVFQVLCMSRVNAEISQDLRRVCVEIDLGTNKSLKFILTGPKRWIRFVSFIY